MSFVNSNCVTYSILCNPNEVVSLCTCTDFCLLSKLCRAAYRHLKGLYPSAEVLPELRSLHWVPGAVSADGGDCPQWCITTTAAQSWVDPEPFYTTALPGLTDKVLGLSDQKSAGGGGVDSLHPGSSSRVLAVRGDKRKRIQKLPTAISYEKVILNCPSSLHLKVNLKLWEK